MCPKQHNREMVIPRRKALLLPSTCVSADARTPPSRFQFCGFQEVMRRNGEEKGGRQPSLHSPRKHVDTHAHTPPLPCAHVCMHTHHTCTGTCIHTPVISHTRHHTHCIHIPHTHHHHYSYTICMCARARTPHPCAHTHTTHAQAHTHTCTRTHSVPHS